jgi:hypothetical protein
MQNMTPQARSTIRAALAAFKGNIYKKCVCTRIALPHHNKNMYEFAAEFKKSLARESGAQGVLFDEKNHGSETS